MSDFEQLCSLLNETLTREGRKGVDGLFREVLKNNEDRHDPQKFGDWSLKLSNFLWSENKYEDYISYSKAVMHDELQPNGMGTLLHRLAISYRRLNQLELSKQYLVQAFYYCAYRKNAMRAEKILQDENDPKIKLQMNAILYLLKGHEHQFDELVLPLTYDPFEFKNLRGNQFYQFCLNFISPKKFLTLKSIVLKILKLKSLLEDIEDLCLQGKVNAYRLYHAQRDWLNYISYALLTDPKVSLYYDMIVRFYTLSIRSFSLFDEQKYKNLTSLVFKIRSDKYISLDSLFSTQQIPVHQQGNWELEEIKKKGGELTQLFLVDSQESSDEIENETLEDTILKIESHFKNKNSHEKLKDLREVKVYKKIIGLMKDEEIREGYKDLCVALIMLEMPEVAIELLDRAMKIANDQMILLYYLKSECLLMFDPAELVRFVDFVLAKEAMTGREYLTFQYLKAEGLRILGVTKKAKKIYEKILVRERRYRLVQERLRELE